MSKKPVSQMSTDELLRAELADRELKRRQEDALWESRRRQQGYEARLRRYHEKYNISLPKD